ncbi:type VI secretion system protein TssA [Pseudomonas schmalbachii]|uniref:Type VI secretion system protein TssA n=1 Tax=Pseudomonas schmalbachii TaxID=2816993 RepID=A0ABS3TUL9_9PSED|nr:type VI secretion system protein TssA [Pseudomonas schmalbachii]MBO3277366.1 type VI secretion system protein TssA [Pseudomonas schmalbachii]
MTYSSKLTAHYLELARRPVSANDFAGEDVRYSSAYETLEDELAKATTLHNSGQIDWQRVREGSEAILRDQSRDLRVAAWLCWALHQCESFPGLLAGAGLLHHLCEHHWEQLHPRKDRTRAAAINWLIPRLEQVMAENLAIKDQLPLFRQLSAHLRGMDDCLSRHLGEESPLLLPICRRLDEMIQRATAGQPEPGSVGAVVAQVKQAASQIISASSAIDNERDAHKTLRALQDNARPLCAWWLQQKATDSRALRLNRTLLWLPIDSLPEHNADHITALRSLPTDKLRSYRERFDRGQYPDLLVDVESSLTRAPFWFDGQRIAWECLLELNAESAMREVEIHFALLLQRLPGLVDLRFHDGSPFADAETRNWIGSRVMPHLQPHGNTRAEPVRDTQAPWEQGLQEALSILRQDGLKSAVQHLKQGLQYATGGRQRFFWQYGLARLCHHAKKYELAKTQLDALDRELQKSGLQQWEPDLCLEVLHLLYNCCELLPQSHVVREHKDEIHRRLCHLDLEMVLD